MARIRPARFVHVVYRTRRFEQMIEWYRTALDCTVQHQNPLLAFMTYDDEHHRVALINLNVVMPDTSHDPRGAVGVDHVAYTYDSVQDLLENYVQLRDKGIKPYWCIHHGITMSMYYADPDGNQMEFQVDAMSAKEANDFMSGPSFMTNPIGVEFDPEEMVAKLRAGTPPAELLKRQSDLPVSPVRSAAIPESVPA